MSKKKRKKRTKKTKYIYEYHYEPICTCLTCGFVHLRKQRKKIKSESKSNIINYLVCPKCGAEPYLYDSDKETKRRRRNINE